MATITKKQPKPVTKKARAKVKKLKKKTSGDVKFDSIIDALLKPKAK
jgi:hypothetical protein